jgi:hypothetical protein
MSLKMPDYILCDNEKIAQPAFRTLLYCDGSLNDPENARGVTALFDALLQHFGKDLAWVAIGDAKHKLRPKEKSDKVLADARKWINTPDKSFPATLRMLGEVSDETDNITVPAFRVDEYRMMMLDISVPDDPARIGPFAEAVTAIIKEMPVISAVMGMGFYLPVALGSLNRWMPRAYPRYRAAIEFSVEGATMGQRKTEEGFRWDKNPDVQPGICDISWRTFVGAEFFPRLPNLDAVAGAAGVTLDRDNTMAVLTAGPAPIWGDVNSGEDIGPYKAVAAALAPVRYPLLPALGTLFGNQDDDPDGINHVKSYLARYDDDF